jgi:pyruvate/2-oxoglutarate dehydrogenase complex dihydrolipoamide acyltransferase (E2) component
MRPVLIALALMLAAAAPAAAAGPIQPGAEARSEAGGCTFNFVFDGAGLNAGRTYIGLAAHCVEKVGEALSDSDGDEVGKVAFIGNADAADTDYAFIEVTGANLERVDPALKGHPEYPKGYTLPDETAAGDLVQMSGYGAGFGLTQPTQEMRQVVLQGDDDAIYWLSGPSVNGDSGGPFVHVKTGKALGVVSRYGFETASTDVGPTVQGILAKAAKAGFPVTLRSAGQKAPAAAAPAPQPAAPAAQPASPQPAAAQPAPAAKKKKAAKAKKKCAAKKGKAKRAKKCRRARRR